MVKKQELQNTLNSMILSASGWRGVFAADSNEESKTDKISDAHKFISAAAAHVFAEFMGAGAKRPQILIARDTRPTGEAIASAMIPVLLSLGCDVCYGGVCAAPEIMSWARSENSASMAFTDMADSVIPIGFIYISASHNPIGYNGIKFGLTSGGVLEADKAVELIAAFRAFLEKDDCVQIIEKLILEADSMQVQSAFAFSEVSKSEALRTYYEFCAETAFGDNTGSDSLSFISSVASIVNKNIGIVCDFNGSARAASIDKDFYDSLGLKFKSINNTPGEIVHRIVPEGESLEPCREFLEEVHAQDPSFLIGYVPDCDGDRGNLVIWDDAQKKARALEAQEVFALACVAEFAYQVWLGEATAAKKAVAVNDPTSMRVDRIAEVFGVKVFRAEVGEANVVTLARNLRKEGYTVRILGEGSAGGNITHPSAVRDPIHTVLALVKLLAIREQGAVNSEQLTVNSEQNTGLFDIWCHRSGQSDKYKEDFTLSDVIDSLPKFVTTPAYSDDAVLRINTDDHALLKERYQKIFEREWKEREEEFKSKLNICKWEAIAYNGLEEKRSIKHFKDAGKGGLKILFSDKDGREVAFIWMRGSATEPVFRIMADVEGTEKEVEQLLLNWQRDMIMEADSSC